MQPLVRFFFGISRAGRRLLAPLIPAVVRLTAAKGLERSAEKQAEVDAQSRRFVLYHFRACPFCIKTRRAIKRLSLAIELRDARHDPNHRQELLRGGGEIKVPCLRIVEGGGTVRWMYESADIIAYLRRRFAPEGA